MRLDFCPNCEREFSFELVGFDGLTELVEQAEKQEEGFMTVTGGEAEVVIACGCDAVTMDFGPASTSAWDIPEHWREAIRYQMENEA